MNNKILTHLFVASDINGLIIHQITDFKLIFHMLLVFLHENQFYYWLVHKHAMNHFWMDIYSTGMFLANFTSILGHILGKDSTGRSSLITAFSFSRIFLMNKAKIYLICPSKKTVLRDRYQKLPSIHYLLHILWLLLHASLHRKVTLPCHLVY